MRKLFLQNCLERRPNFASAAIQHRLASTAERLAPSALADQHIKTFFPSKGPTADSLAMMADIYEQKQKALYGDDAAEEDLDEMAEVDAALLKHKKVKKTFTHYENCLLRRNEGTLTPWMRTSADALFDKLLRFFQRHHLISAEEAAEVSHVHFTLFGKGVVVSQKEASRSVDNLLNFFKRFE